MAVLMLDKRLHPLANLLLAAKQQQGSADADTVARTQPANLDDVAIYSRAIGAPRGQ